MEQSPLESFLGSFYSEPINHVATCLKFSDLQSLLLATPSAQHSPIHDAYLERTTLLLPPLADEDSMVRGFRSDVRWRAIRVTSARDLPTVLTTNACITCIDLEGIQTTTNDIKKLASVSSLTRVGLKKTLDVDITTLAQLQQLQHLDLTGTRFSGDLVAFVQLRSLVLNKTCVKSIAFVSELVLLEKLELREVFKRLDLTPLGELRERHRLSSLDCLKADDCSFARTSLADFISHLPDFKQLEVLSFNDMDVSVEASLTWLSPFALLRRLEIVEWRVDDITPLKHCTQLEVLGINLCDILVPDVIETLLCLQTLQELFFLGTCLPYVLGALPNLLTLGCELADWEDFDNEEDQNASLVEMAGRPHTALETIKLKNTTWHPHVSLLVPNLKYLSVQNEVPDVENLLVWPNLRSLHIESDTQLPDNFVQAIVSGLSELVDLYIDDQERSTSPAIQVQTGASLKFSKLVLINCQSFTLDALFELQTLVVLNLTGWEDVNYEDALSHSNGLPHLKSITLDPWTSCQGLKTLAPSKLPVLTEIIHLNSNCLWNSRCPRRRCGKKNTTLRAADHGTSASPSAM